jgi:hypothetical protein
VLGRQFSNPGGPGDDTAKRLKSGSGSYGNDIMKRIRDKENVEELLVMFYDESNPQEYATLFKGSLEANREFPRTYEEIPMESFPYRANDFSKYMKQEPLFDTKLLDSIHESRCNLDVFANELLGKVEHDSYYRRKPDEYNSIMNVIKSDPRGQVLSKDHSTEDVPPIFSMYLEYYYNRFGCDWGAITDALLMNPITSRMVPNLNEKVCEAKWVAINWSKRQKRLPNLKVLSKINSLLWCNPIISARKEGKIQKSSSTPLEIIAQLQAKSAKISKKEESPPDPRSGYTTPSLFGAIKAKVESKITQAYDSFNKTLQAKLSNDQTKLESPNPAKIKHPESVYREMDTRAKKGGNPGQLQKRKKKGTSFPPLLN